MPRDGNTGWCSVWSDPNKFFCGNPYDEESYGIYARGLQKALAKAAGDHYEFLDETGTSTETLLKKYIDQDMPVVFWACINMRKEIPGPEWKLLDTGERFCWTSNEHCMLLVGYDEEKYYFNDPYDNNGVVGYPRTLVEKETCCAAQYGAWCLEKMILYQKVSGFYKNFI